MAIRILAMALAAALVASCGDAGDAGLDGTLPTRLASASTAAPTTVPSSDDTTTTGPGTSGPTTDPARTVTDDVAEPADAVGRLDEAATLADDVTSARAGSVVEVERPAGATDRADRRDDPVTIAWIGGSDVVWEDRSLPATVAPLLPRVGHRPATFRAATDIGPTPDEIASIVRAEAAGGAEALIVAMNVSWAAWGGTDRCTSIEPGYTRYVCILEPAAGDELEARRGALERLVAAIVDTGLPTYVYVIPHSRQAMADPRLDDRIDAAEAFIAGFDPRLPHVRWEPRILTRGVEGADEGTAFRDMVHPTADGVVILAELLAPRFESFFGPRLG